MTKYPGKFIVIDGTDGTGKTTQLSLLKDKLLALGYEVETADFPQYGQKSAGLVEEYLSGKYGSAEEVGPYKGSIFYAVDRFDASFKIKRWLEEGKIVISNRYVAANMAHQGSKIANDIERKIYFNWLHDLEYNIFGIPRPDVVLILHIKAEVAQALAQNKESSERKQQSGSGLVGKDIHEKDINHLKMAEKVYLEIAENFSGFELVECEQGGQLMSREEIHEKITGLILALIEKK